MKKRIISLLLAVVMVIGTMPLSAMTAFANEEYTPATEIHADENHDGRCDGCGLLAETICFSEDYTTESEHFTLEAPDYDSDGWYCNDGNGLVVTSKNGELIRGINAVIGYDGDDYYNVAVSSGDKMEKTGVEDDSTVHITGVDECEFSFTCEDEYVQFKDITVFFEIHTHTITEIQKKDATESEHGSLATHYYCAGCGWYFADPDGENRISKETAESYIIHHWSSNWQSDCFGHCHTCTCEGCETIYKEPHTGYSDDGICDVCGYSGVFTETIYFIDSDTAESEHFTLKASSNDPGGWYGGGFGEEITITSKNNELIKNIEAIVCCDGLYYGGVGVSGGTKEEKVGVKDGATVHITGIEECDFSFIGGSECVGFKDITVFFTIHTHTITEIQKKDATESEHGISTTHYYCAGCGWYFADPEGETRISKETGESYIIHHWSSNWQSDCFGHYHTCTCEGCEAIYKEPHTGYSDDGICDACGYSGMFAETIYFNENDTAESGHFTVEDPDHDEDGWFGGDGYVLTVTSKNGEQIENIEAVIGYDGENYGDVGVSSGTKEENGWVETGATVHVTGVGKCDFSFIGGSGPVQFKDITVFFTIHTHTITEIQKKDVTESEHGISTTHYYCAGCGRYFADPEGENRISKETAESYIIHYWTDWSMGDCFEHTRTCICEGCEVIDKKAHTGYSDDGVCDVCGYSGLFAETIYFNKRDAAESEHFMLEAFSHGSSGWCGGGDGETITITSKNSEIIKNIEAIVDYRGMYYDEVGVSGGNKEENGEVEDGNTAHITGVDDYSFSFTGGSKWVQFRDITVFFEIDAHIHELTKIPKKDATELAHGISTTHYYCAECDRYFADSEGKKGITEETAKSYIIHHWSSNWQSDGFGHYHVCTYDGCEVIDRKAHTGYSDDGVCDVCGYSGLFAETIYFNDSNMAESEHFTLETLDYSENGWYGGGDGQEIIITAKNGDLIKNIEAIVTVDGEYYGKVGVSGGTKEENGGVEDGSTVHITGIDNDTFSFADGDDWLVFKDITVFFEISHEHVFTYTPDGGSMIAKCSFCNTEIIMSIQTPASLIYDGNEKPATLDNADEFIARTGAAVGEIRYKREGENEYTGNVPKNAGKYFVSVMVADKEITAEFDIKKATPVANDFTYIPPHDCTLDGQPKNAEIRPKNTGIGIVTVKYQKYNGTDWDVILTDAPNEIGKYRVAIIVSEGENYYFSDIITSAEWVFELICQHYYVDFVCKYCHAENLEGAKHDAVREIQNTVDHSEDAVLKLLEENAKDDIERVDKVADVLQLWDYWLTAINKQLGTLPHEHTFADIYSHNDTHHWRECTCEDDECKGNVTGFKVHAFTVVTNDDGSKTYTCTVCDYTKTVYEGGSSEGEHVQGVVKCDGISLTLDSYIYINFYMQLTEEALENGRMVFRIGSRTVEGVTAKLNEDKGRYYFACPLNVLEMAETVTAEFTYGSTKYTQDYSVKRYIEKILTETDKDGEFVYAPAMRKLARKIANYGYCAQLYLESIHADVTIGGEHGYAAMLDNFKDEISIENALKLTDGFTASPDTANLTFVGRTVYFDSATALNFYVTTKDGNAPTAICDKGKTVEITQYSDYTCIVSVKDITATELADSYTVTVSHGGDKMTLKGDVLDYCVAVINAHRGKTTDKDVKAVNAMAAFYEYYEAACDYVKKQGKE